MDGLKCQVLLGGGSEVEAVLRTYFQGYQDDTLFWCPLLAYAFIRGDSFVAVPDGGYAMPVPMGAAGDQAWNDYDFGRFLNDGLAVARFSGIKLSLPIRFPKVPQLSL